MKKPKLIDNLIENDLIFYLLLALGSFYRFYKFDSWSFSNDELSAISRLNFDSFAELISHGVKIDGHPAVTQLFEYLWIQVFAISTIRIPFVLFGILTIYFLYRTAVLWIGKFPSLFVAAFVVVSQFFVLYSQIARPYSLGCFLTVLFAYFWTLLIKRKQSYSTSIGFVIVAVFAALSHYFATLAIIILSISGLFVCPKERIKKYFFHLLFIVVLCLPHLSITIHQLSIGGVGAWLPAPKPGFIWEFLNYSSNGFLPFQVSVIIAAILPLFITDSRDYKIPLIVIALCVFIFSFLVGYFYSTGINPVLQFSTLIFSFPFFLIFLFAGSRYEHHKKLGLLILLLMVATGSYGLLIERDFYGPKKSANFRDVAENVQHYTDSLGSENLLLFMNSSDSSYFNYYFDKSGERPVVDIPFFGGYREIAHAQQLLSNDSVDYVMLAWANSTMPFEIHELIKKSFPNRIVHHHYFNSEFTIYKKGISDRISLFHRTICGEASDKTADPENKRLDSSATPVDLTSVHIDSTMEFACTYKAKAADIFKNGSEYLTMDLEVRGNMDIDAMVVVSVSRNEEQIAWRGFDLSEFQRDSEWFHPLFVYGKNEEIRSTDQLSIYIWNPHKNSFWINDFSLQVFEDSDYDYYNPIVTKYP